MRYSLSHAFRVSPSEPARGPMLCLEGYIPYVFAHATYNASVNIWIPPQYPALPPRLLVFAGPGTMLNPNPHLDQNGLFYHSYLTEWSSNPNTHNLMDAISIAVETFDMISPVISAPPAFNAASHPSSQAGTPRSAAGTPNGYGRTSTPPSAAARMTPPSSNRDAVRTHTPAARALLTYNCSLGGPARGREAVVADERRAGAPSKRLRHNSRGRFGAQAGGKVRIARRRSILCC